MHGYRCCKSINHEDFLLIPAPRCLMSGSHLRQCLGQGTEDSGNGTFYAAHMESLLPLEALASPKLGQWCCPTEQKKVQQTKLNLHFR